MGTQAHGKLLQRLEAAAGERPRLYHATRVVLGVRPQLPPGVEPVSRWCSGIDPAGGWDEFLGAQTEVFEAHEYERRSRWQQSCFYGDAGWMNEYTRLTAEAQGALPPDFAVPRDFSRTLYTDRDVWTLFLYRVALGNRAAFGLDTRGLAPYADFVFPGLETIVACTREDRDSEEPMVDRFRDEFHRGTGRPPDFVYAALWVDVFSASVLGLRYLIENREQLFGSPDDFIAMVSTPVAEHPPGGERAAASTDGEGEAKGREQQRVAGRNEERDLWIYERCMAGERYAMILEELRTHSEGPAGWYALDSVQAVQQAAVRYATRHQLSRPPRRKDRG